MCNLTAVWHQLWGQFVVQFSGIELRNTDLQAALSLWAALLSHVRNDSGNFMGRKVTSISMLAS